MEKRDYYEVLGIGKDASKEDIKRAYRRLARRYHPDVNKAEDAEERFKEISEAYAVLSDDERRWQYDRFGHAGMAGYTPEDIFRNIDFDDIFRDLGFGPFGGFGDIFDTFFGGRTRRRAGPQKGADLRYNLEIDFKDAAFGTKTEIEVPLTETCDVCNGSGAEPGTSPKTCPSCNGSGQISHTRRTHFGQFSTITTCGNCHGEGRVIDNPCQQCNGSGKVKRNRKISVKIPAGVDNGFRLRIAGKGEIGERGGSPGDLYVVIYVRPHEIFERHGSDIFCKVPISFTQAALGSETEIPTLDGNAKLKIPPGTQTGTVFRFKGKGIPNLHGHGRGDQHVKVVIKTPEKLTPEQKELLERFDELSREATASTKGGFFGRMKKDVKDVFGSDS
ncbi:MAG: molecular chaperone DnaJ [Candidatus Hydrothermarchaeales archaeon]